MSDVNIGPLQWYVLLAERSAPRAAARRQGHDCTRCLGLAVRATGSFVLRHHAPHERKCSWAFFGVYAVAQKGQHVLLIVSQCEVKIDFIIARKEIM